MHGRRRRRRRKRRRSEANQRTLDVEQDFGVWRNGRSVRCASIAGTVLIMCTLIFSCAVGPDYRRPPIDAAAVFRGPDGGAQASFADLPWWEVFNDTRLKDLIKTALTNNYDLRATASRIEQARALAAQTRAQFFPQLGYDGEITRGKNSFFNRAAPSGGRISDSALGLLSIAWELDLWGRIRRADEAARAQLFAAGEARRGVMLSLVSDVAQAYFELLELDLQLEIAKRTTKSFDDTLRIFRERLEGGVASKLETARAEASLATAASSVPDLERVIVIKENQINFLLSRDPGPIPRAAVLLDQRVPPDIPAGLPSILLERRPDVRQAEQELVAANAQIGVAVADFFPKIGLTTFFGRASAALSDFSSGKANTWAIAGAVSGPIFQGGRLVGQYDQAEAQWQEAQLHYQQTALNAFQEVSNALTSRQKLEEIRIQQVRAVAALIKAVQFSTQRYVAGLSSYFEVLEAQQQLFPAENALAQTQLNQLLVVVQLYKALGGSWNLADDKWTGP
jgi:multidrug efflux system outer membrane protein